MRKELSPLSCRSHMVYDFSTQLFVFGYRIWFIHNTMFSLLLQPSTKKTIFDTFVAIEAIPKVRYIFPAFWTKTDIVGEMPHRNWFIAIRRIDTKTTYIIAVMNRSFYDFTVMYILSSCNIEWIKYIFWFKYLISKYIFWFFILMFTKNMSRKKWFHFCSNGW